MKKNDFKILLVDNEVFFAITNENFLKHYEYYNIISAFSEEEAREIYNFYKPDLIVIDPYFPEKKEEYFIESIINNGFEGYIILESDKEQIEKFKELRKSVNNFMLKKNIPSINDFFISKPDMGNQLAGYVNLCFEHAQKKVAADAGT
jgi:response regulator of citrate/malate metabolism